MAEKEHNKYIVMKRSHVEAILTETEKEILGCLMDKLHSPNKYVVCNQDEPYSEKVWEAILEGEMGKLEDGEPCKHPGCLNHVTHPCEGCGRIAGRRS